MKWLSSLAILGILGSGCGAGISAPQSEASHPQSNLTADETEFVRLLNTLRKEQGLGELRVDPTLEATAAHHSSYMSSLSLLTHSEPSPNGSSSDRISNLGGSFNYTGENVAFGSNGAGSLFDQWYGSSGHRKNMLSPKYQYIGISGNNGYWTADFAGD